MTKYTSPDKGCIHRKRCQTRTKPRTTARARLSAMTTLCPPCQTTDPCGPCMESTSECHEELKIWRTVEEDTWVTSTRFVPVQRWSHNVEHGAVVMAYNPCLDPDTVDRLRKLVTGCIRCSILYKCAHLLGLLIECLQVLLTFKILWRQHFKWSFT